MYQTDWLTKQAFWLLPALLFAGINMVLLNDTLHWVPGAETMLVEKWGQGLPAYPFLLRLPGALLFFAVLAITYFQGKRFFGKETALLALFVLSGSLLAINAVKWVSGDPWLLFFYLLAILGMIGYLKNPQWQWRLTGIAGGVFSIALQPLGAFAGLLAMALFWRFRHPDGKRLDQLYWWIWGPVVFALSWWWRGGVSGDPYLYTSWLAGRPGWVLGAQFLGMLPWLGFLTAGLVEIIRNQKKGEELSILLAGLLAGALLSGSLVLQWAFALVVAKQLQRFLLAGYPYGNVVKTISILQLAGVLLVGIAGMVYGYLEWGGTGFRIGMSLILAYWMPALFGTIGVFGGNQRLVVLGYAAGTLLLSLAFWAQIGPRF